MGKFYIKKDQDGVFSASEANGTWIVNEGVTINSDSDFAFASSWENTNLVVRGTLNHTNQFGSAVAVTGPGSGVTVTKTGRISSTDNGVFFDTVDDLSLVNHGRIEASSGAVAQGDGVVMKNFGKIVASESYAIRISGDDGEVINAEGGLIRGNIGLEFENVTAGTTKVVNHGTIKGDDWAISGGDAIDHIVNRGALVGSVLLGAGDDYFDTRGGTVTGDIAGGGGADTYLVSDASISIFEALGDGYDTLATTVSCAIGGFNEIEELIALGNKNINLTGNEIDNRLNGNHGDNRLVGKGGEDWFNGGKGDDRFTGGADLDHFIFAKGGGNDIVTDFTSGEDSFYVSNFYLDNDYADLQKHMHEVDGDLVIKLGKDSITLRDTQIGDVDVNDFNFANA